MSSPDSKKRATSSCDYCRKHKAKCSRIEDGNCRRCLKTGRQCIISNTRTGRPYYQTSKEQYELMTSLVRHFLPNASLEIESLRELVAELNNNGISNAPQSSSLVSVASDNGFPNSGPTPPASAAEGSSTTPMDLSMEFQFNSPPSSVKDGLVLDASHSESGLVSLDDLAEMESKSRKGQDGKSSTQSIKAPNQTLETKTAANAKQTSQLVPLTAKISETFPIDSVARRDVMEVTRYDCGSSWPAFFAKIHATVGKQGNLFPNVPFVLDEITDGQHLEPIYPDSLPSRSDFEKASSRFFAEINCVNYILSYEEFHTYIVMVYEQNRPLSHAGVMLLYLILSFDEKYGDYYFKGCQHIESVLQEGSLASVQALMLTTLCRLNRNERNFAWITMGSASRIAQSLGLHLKESCWEDKSPTVIENRKRLWWSLYDLEICLSCRLGRYPGIDQANCSVSMPSETMFNVIPNTPPDYHRATYRLTKLTGRIVWDLYGPRSGQIALDSRADELLDDLLCFWEELPSHLKPDVQIAPSHSRAILYLALRYYYSILLVTRPSIVSCWCNSGSCSSELMRRVDLCEVASKQSLFLLRRMKQNNLLSRRNFLDTSYILANMVIYTLRLVKKPSLELLDEAEECIQILNYTQHLNMGRVIKRNLSVTVQELKSMLDVPGSTRDLDGLFIDELLQGLFGTDFGTEEYMWPTWSNDGPSNNSWSST